MANQTDVAEVVGMLLDAYPTRELNNPRGFIETAVAVLRDVDSASLKAGALDCIAELKFFPSLAELRDRAKKARLGGHTKIEQPGIRPEIARARATQHLADKEPLTWTEEDYKEFERWYGKRVWWQDAELIQT